eukprot:TRINITY_DN10495_c0_g1_i2.p1 TRINITY_DN10495_c0_g1~~TRINITY_DN10495_c0_g1_i2.p1  ORF type:complete len:355 (-),score=59.09 TRINITY_DN10495_c0_g1_i2:74-1138(-)
MITKLGGTSELIALFRRFDADRDGHITRKELASFLADRQHVNVDQISENRLDEIFAKADKNRDGLINYEEFGDWIIAENQRDEVVSLFRRFDGNGDGAISRGELRSFLARKNKLSENQVPEHKIDDMMGKADKDGDGFINYEEFVAWVLGENAIDRDDEPGQRRARAAAAAAPALRQGGLGVVSCSGQDHSRRDDDTLHIVPHMRSVEGTSPRDVLAMFERFDANKDGSISKTELRALLSQKLKVDVTEDQLNTVLAKADKTGNGSLSYQEFVQWMLADSSTKSRDSFEARQGRPRLSPLGQGGRSVLAGGVASPRAEQPSDIYSTGRDRRTSSMHQAHPSPLAMFSDATSRLR